MAMPVCMKRMRREREQLEQSSSSEYCVQFKDEDLLNFTAYISGPEDSLYNHKFLKLNFNIPSNYPLVPPKVTFVQHSGGRIHPNLYVEGKVCLSILGTWPGEPWATAMNVESILITIRSLLDNKPYMHEPGQRDNPGFNDYVRYATWQCLLFDHLTLEKEPRLRAFMEQYIRDNGHKMMSDLRQQQEYHTAASTFTSGYGRQSINVNYPLFIQTLQTYISKYQPPSKEENEETKDTRAAVCHINHIEIAEPDTPDLPLALKGSGNKRRSVCPDANDGRHPAVFEEAQHKKRKVEVIDLT